jgi:hypothetical protein
MRTLSEDQRAAIQRQFAEIHERFSALHSLNLGSVKPALEPLPKQRDLDGTVFGLHLRSLGWGFSISRLADVFDFQAHSAGCRSLCEIVVDLALLTRDAEQVEKMLAWERLTTFRSANKMLKSPGGDALVKQAAAEFANANDAAVAAARAQHWPNGSNPMRWTGRPLSEDCARADAVAPTLRLGEFMREHYDRLCWATHGSSLMLVRSIPEDLFPGLATLAVHEGANLLEHAMRLVLEHFKLAGAGWTRRMQSTLLTPARLASLRKSLAEAMEAAERTT